MICKDALDFLYNCIQLVTTVLAGFAGALLAHWLQKRTRRDERIELAKVKLWSLRLILQSLVEKIKVTGKLVEERRCKLPKRHFGQKLQPFDFEYPELVTLKNELLLLITDIELVKSLGVFLHTLNRYQMQYEQLREGVLDNNTPNGDFEKFSFDTAALQDQIQGLESDLKEMLKT